MRNTAAEHNIVLSLGNSLLALNLARKIKRSWHNICFVESTVFTTSNTANTGVGKYNSRAKMLQSRLFDHCFMGCVSWISPHMCVWKVSLNKMLMLLKHKVELFLCDRISTSSPPRLPFPPLPTTFSVLPVILQAPCCRHVTEVC